MLRKAFLDSRNAEDASDHAIAVGRVCLPWLVDWLDHSRAKVRQAALRSLQRFAESSANHEAVSGLLASKMRSIRILVADPSHSPRVFALSEGARLLAQMSDYRARPFLYEQLEGDNPALAGNAAAQLAELKETTAASAIGAALLGWEKRAAKPWRLTIGPTVVVSGFIFFFFGRFMTDIDPDLWGILKFAFIVWIILSVASGFLTQTRGSVGRNWSNTRSKFTAALASLDTPLSIGPLALCTDYSALREMAITSLGPLLVRVQSPGDVALTQDQAKALTKLLDVENDGFRRPLINALSLIGDEQSLAALKRFAKDKRRPEEMKELAAQAAAALQLRLSGRSDERVLLRATDPEHEHETLLRSADGDYEVPSDQLLRQANPES